MPWKAADEKNWPIQIAQDLLGLHLHAMASLLSAHAASSGAGGDCDFRAQLRLAPHFSQNGYRTITPTVIAAPEPALDAIPITHYEQTRNSITVGSEFLNARTTTSLDELTHTWHASIQTRILWQSTSSATSPSPTPASCEPTAPSTQQASTLADATRSPPG